MAAVSPWRPSSVQHSSAPPRRAGHATPPRRAHPCEAHQRCPGVPYLLPAGRVDWMCRCDRCDMWVHPRCDGITSGTLGAWAELRYLCPTCRGARPGEEFVELPSRCPLSSTISCHSCQRTERQIGTKCSPTQLPHMLGNEVWLLCEQCQERWQRREFCPICEKLYAEPAADAGSYAEDMLQCEACNLWVHADCDHLPCSVTGVAADIDYLCPSCRGTVAGAGEIVEQLRRLDAESQLAAQARAKAEEVERIRSECADNGACPVCKALWKPTDIDMVACDSCELWVHIKCERLPRGSVTFFEGDHPYRCPLCRGEAAGEGEEMDRVRTQACARNGYCAVCARPWKMPPAIGGRRGEPKDDDMVECDLCSLWVHLVCDGMPRGNATRARILGDSGDSYACPSCRAQRTASPLAGSRNVPDARTVNDAPSRDVDLVGQISSRSAQPQPPPIPNRSTARMPPADARCAAIDTIRPSDEVWVQPNKGDLWHKAVAVATQSAHPPCLIFGDGAQLNSVGSLNTTVFAWRVVRRSSEGPPRAAPGANSGHSHTSNAGSLPRCTHARTTAGSADASSTPIGPPTPNLCQRSDLAPMITATINPWSLSDQSSATRQIAREGRAAAPLAWSEWVQSNAITAGQGVTDGGHDADEAEECDFGGTTDEDGDADHGDGDAGDGRGDANGAEFAWAGSSRQSTSCWSGDMRQAVVGGRAAQGNGCEPSLESVTRSSTEELPRQVDSLDGQLLRAAAQLAIRAAARRAMAGSDHTTEPEAMVAQGLIEPAPTALHPDTPPHTYPDRHTLSAAAGSHPHATSLAMAHPGSHLIQHTSQRLYQPPPYWQPHLTAFRQPEYNQAMWLSCAGTPQLVPQQGAMANVYTTSSGHAMPIAHATPMPVHSAALLATHGVPCRGFVFDPVAFTYVRLGDEAEREELYSSAVMAEVDTMTPAALPATTEERAAAAAELRTQYEAYAARFEPLASTNVQAKMQAFCSQLAPVYGELPFAELEWGTSVLGTLVGLICAQTCRNSWSSIGYSNLACTFPTDTGEPNWDLICQRAPADIEPCIWHGPYFHRKAERIHALLKKAYVDSGGVSTSLERLHSWSNEQIRHYLMSFNGLSGKSVACLLLYRMGRCACPHPARKVTRMVHSPTSTRLTAHARGMLQR